MSWNPRLETVGLLNRAMEHIHSVDYQVSARWVFYRLLQEGLLRGKTSIGAFSKLTSKARKSFWNGWTPDLLADETRKSIERSWGFDSEEDWASENRVTLDKYIGQEYGLVICYEARAMSAQFQRYTDGVDLWPFAGDPSIPYKWDLAQRLEDFERPAVVYFGDLDPKGQTIGPTAFADVMDWCSSEVEVVYAGLTPEQVARMNVPANPGKPGEYQWEALTDPQARELIEAAIAPFWNEAAYRDVLNRQSVATATIQEQLADLEL